MKKLIFTSASKHKKATLISVVVLTFCILLCSCGRCIDAADAEKRFSEVFADVSRLPASYASHRVDEDSGKFVIAVTDDRRVIKEQYIAALGEEYSDVIEFEKHELSEAELWRITDDAENYIKSKGYTLIGANISVTGNIINIQVDDASVGACALSDEISEKYGVRVIIECGGTILAL